MTKKPTIIFFGTPLFGQIVLKRLLEEDLKIVAVVTQPDRPVGREGKKASSPVKTLGKEKKIQVFTPANKDELLTINHKLAKLKPDLFVVASYGMIIPPEILSIPSHGALNVHPSLLPKYRGASPIQAAILAGESETGVTIMLMDEQMDHGPILAQEKILLEPAETTPTAMVKLAQAGGELLTRTIPRYLADKITPQSQDHSQATYTKLIKKEDGRVNWAESNLRIERMVRAYNPWPGVWTTVGEMAEQLKRELRNARHQNLRLKILQAHIENGTISLDLIQVEGKNPISFADFGKGYFA
ncbi:MAG: methionyl-tRNA formyltransferase [candidate division WWE3 bacterium]|nr:methionyl-tRNA formyltransferase [candidate division WWE3 bacterium]